MAMCIVGFNLILQNNKRATKSSSKIQMEFKMHKLKRIQCNKSIKHGRKIMQHGDSYAAI